MRRRRFKRRRQENIRITDRDRRILAVVYEYRVLDSRQIARVMNAPVKRIVERLQLLYHHGLLDRPKVQTVGSRYTAGSRPIIYALGVRGADLLAEQYGELRSVIRWGYKNSRLQYRYLEHRLMVSAVMVAFTIACRHNDAALVSQSQVLRAADNRLSNPIHIASAKLAIGPDQVFALDQADGRREYFFLELDRGTMPIKRKKKATASSMYSKLERYARLFEEKQHRTSLGISNFRVLFVTPSAARIERIIGATQDVRRSRGIFLFAEYEDVVDGNPLTIAWKNGRGEEVRLG